MGWCRAINPNTPETWRIQSVVDDVCTYVLAYIRFMPGALPLFLQTALINSQHSIVLSSPSGNVKKRYVLHYMKTFLRAQLIKFSAVVYPFCKMRTVQTSRSTKNRLISSTYYVLRWSTGVTISNNPFNTIFLILYLRNPAERIQTTWDNVARSHYRL